MFNSLVYVFFLSVLGIIIPYPVFAKNLSFTATTTTLASDESMMVTASTSGFIDGESIYVKGAFYTDGSSNYFGYTQKNDQWVKNSAKTIEQNRVTIGSWDGSVRVKADNTDSGFPQSGTYKLKLGFYTIGIDGEPSSVHWSTSTADIFLHKAVPTSTPTKVPTNAPTHTVTPIHTQIPMKTPTIQVVSPTLKSTVTLRESNTPTEVTAAVLGIVEDTESENIVSADDSQPNAVQAVKKNSDNAIIPLLFIGLGTGILSFVTLGGTIWKRLREKNKE